MEHIIEYLPLGRNIQMTDMSDHLLFIERVLIIITCHYHGDRICGTVDIHGHFLLFYTLRF